VSARARSTALTPERDRRGGCPSSSAPATPAALWRWPIGLGVATAIGLLAALLGDAAWDALSWFALGAPVTVAAWFAWRRPAT